MKLAWKEIRYNKAKYFLIEVILILMIFMVLFLSGLANGLSRAVSSVIENIDAQSFVVSSDAENLITISNLDVDILKQVKEQTSDSVATLDIQRMNLNQVGSDKKLDVTYFAIEANSFLMPSIKDGKAINNENEIVLNDTFKDNGIELGDTIVDSTTNIEMKVVGFTHDESYGHTPVGFILTDTYTAIRSEMNPTYKQYYHAIAVQGEGKKINIDDVDVASKANIINSIPGYSQEQTTINMIVWVLVVISAAILGVFFYVLTVQKEHQFGVLKAIGMRMSELSIVVMSQIFIIAFMGIVIGNILVNIMAFVLPSTMPFYMEMSSALLVSLAFLAISILSGLISMRRIAKVDPIVSIGGNE